MSSDAYHPRPSQCWEVAVLKLLSNVPGDEITRRLIASLRIAVDADCREVSLQSDLDGTKDIGQLGLAFAILDDGR